MVTVVAQAHRSEYTRLVPKCPRQSHRDLDHDITGTKELVGFLDINGYSSVSNGPSFSCGYLRDNTLLVIVDTRVINKGTVDMHVMLMCHLPNRLFSSTKAGVVRHYPCHGQSCRIIDLSRSMQEEDNSIPERAWYADLVPNNPIVGTSETINLTI
jgi:hypothetical protein